MHKTLSISVDDVVPSVAAILKAQSIPQGVTPSDRIAALAREAISLYQSLSDPVGTLMDISRADFETVYAGEGRNEDVTPLDPIYRSSGALALFAVTIGEKVCAEISRLFDTRDFALGSMLDAAASEGAEMAAEALESSQREYLTELGRIDPATGVLRFSPGYCGWHISAQRQLFEFLHPGEIGISLGDSFLMQPLKSITGVIITGPKEIFVFDDDFPFCSECSTRSCRERIGAVMNS